MQREKFVSRRKEERKEGSEPLLQGRRMVCVTNATLENRVGRWAIVYNCIL